MIYSSWPEKDCFTYMEEAYPKHQWILCAPTAKKSFYADQYAPMQYLIKIATLLLQMQPTSLHQNFVPPFTQFKNQSVIWIPKHLRLLWQTKQNVWLKRIQWPKLQFRYLSILLWKSSRRAPTRPTKDKIIFVLHQPSPSLLMIKNQTC